MKNAFLWTGFGNYVQTDRILAITHPESQQVKRLINAAWDNNMLIDHRSGRKRLSAIVLDTGHVVLSAISPETLVARATRSPGE